MLYFCVVPTTSVEISVGSPSSIEISNDPSLTNIFACPDLPANDDQVLDFSEDKSSFLGLVVANVHAGTTTNVSKDAECLVDESSSLGLVTAKMHTETTAHLDGRVVESPACVFLIDLAGVNADVHIRITVETDAIAASSVDKCLISGSPVHDVKFTGFAVSDVLSSCCSVFGSLYVTFLFSTLGMLSQLSLLVWAPVLLCVSFHHFMIQFILKYTGSPAALADLDAVFCSYAVKRFVFDTPVTLYLPVVLVFLYDNLCSVSP